MVGLKSIANEEGKQAGNDLGQIGLHSSEMAVIAQRKGTIDDLCCDAHISQADCVQSVNALLRARRFRTGAIPAGTSPHDR